MKTQGPGLFRAILSAAIMLAVSVAFAEEGIVRMTFLDVSPDRSLPITSRLYNELHKRKIADRIAESNHSMKEAGKQGTEEWETKLQPPRNIESFDGYELLIHTNDVSRAQLEAAALFNAIGFLPVDDFTDSGKRGSIHLQLEFFDELAFLYGGGIPTLVFRRLDGQTGYRSISMTPTSRGTVKRKTLGDSPVFYFQQDLVSVLEAMTKTYPTAASLWIWDRDGILAYHSRYDKIKWRENDVMITEEMMAIDAPCGLSSSAFKCQTSGNACQLSLLDVRTSEPVVLTASSVISYNNGQLIPQRITIGAKPLLGYEGGGVVCERFDSIAKILSGTDFGICGRNIGGVTAYRCVGSAQSYLNESLERSLLYWLALENTLESLPPLRVEVDPVIWEIVESAKAARPGPVIIQDRPYGLGHGDVIDFIERSLSAMSAVHK